MTPEPSRARSVLTKQLFGSRWSSRRLLRRPPGVIAIFSFRYDANLVPDLIENLRPIVDGFIAYDDREATTPYTDERQRKAALLQAARDMGARWVLHVDPDERLERAASARMPIMTSGVEPVIWKFRLREMYTPQAYRADGIWRKKRVSCLFPLLEGQAFSNWLLHGQRGPINPEYKKRDSGLNLYHLKMIAPERRQARRDLYKALDPYNAYQKIGYDYLGDEAGLILKKISSSRGYRPLHREAGGLWQVDAEVLRTSRRASISKICNSTRRLAYTHVVPLGGNCRPSYQIARYFKFRQVYPFDGWNTPLDSVARCIEMMECDLYDPANLQERIKAGEISVIVNTQFQIGLYHDFKRGGPRVPPNVLPDWRSGIERARSRTNHLIGKLQSLNHSSNRVLFIRLFDDVSNQALFGTRLTPPQATERLVAALRSRFDKISFDLMCVSFEHRLEKPDPSIIYVDICDPATCWQGTDSLWDQAFDQIHARLEPPEASIAS